MEPQSFLSNAKLVIAVKQVPSSDTGTLGFAYRWINNSTVPIIARILVGLSAWGCSAWRYGLLCGKSGGRRPNGRPGFCAGFPCW